MDTRLLFDVSDLPPSWRSGQWAELHGWTHVAADLAIWAAFTTIPVALVYLVRSRRDLPFSGLFSLFAAVILFAGATHLVDAVMVWASLAHLSTGLKVATALVSWAAALVLLRRLPEVLALPGLARVHQNLEDEVAVRRRCEAELEESQRRSQSILDHAPSAIYVKSLDGRIEQSNRELASLVARPLEGVVGRTDTELFGEEQAAQMRERDRRVLEEGAEETEEVLSLAGGPRTYLTSRFPLQNGQGEPYAVGAISTDITDRKQQSDRRAQVEAQLQRAQRLESLASMAGGVAHDFNNLLTGVLGGASLARSQVNDPADLMDSIDMIEQAATRAAELSWQMLAFSGSGRFVAEEVDLSAMVRRSLPALDAAGARRVPVTCELAEGLPAIHADMTQLQQLISNLALNAVEASEAMRGSVVIRTGTTQLTEPRQRLPLLGGELPPGRYVELVVSDEGEGMARETLEGAFEPFFSTREAGRGLGLAAALGIVRGHGGDIRVRSAVGKGTCVEILLPVDSAEVRPDLALVPAKAGARAGDLVLVVDDEPILRSLARRWLTEAGFRVDTAENGRQAVEIFRARRGEIRAVVMDVIMPVMDGVEALGAIRALDPNARIVLTSGYAEREVLADLGEQPEAFLHKPYRGLELVRMLEAILTESPAPRAGRFA